MEDRQVAMFESYDKTLLCRLAFISNFDFAKISRIREDIAKMILNDVIS